MRCGITVSCEVWYHPIVPRERLSHGTRAHFPLRFLHPTSVLLRVARETPSSSLLLSGDATSRSGDRRGGWVAFIHSRSRCRFAPVASGAMLLWNFIPILTSSVGWQLGSSSVCLPWWMAATDGGSSKGFFNKLSRPPVWTDPVAVTKGERGADPCFAVFELVPLIHLQPTASTSATEVEDQLSDLLLVCLVQPS